MAEQIRTSVYQDMMDYFVNLATPEQILAFKVSDATQEHIDELLDKNNEGELTLSERFELDEIVAFDSAMFLLKARAAAKLKSSQ